MRYRTLVLVLLLAGSAVADYLILSRRATVREESNSRSTIINRYDDGQVIEVLDDGQMQNRWYRVRDPETGRSGFVYQSMGRLYRGDPPGATPPAADDPANRIDVMWWNIRNFTSNSRDDTEIGQIADVIRGMEVVAIGELEHPAALPRLCTALGPSWRHANTPKIGRTAHTAEHYGFIWDSDVVAIVGNPQNDPDPNNQFDRDPGWATFRTNDGNLDFTVIAVHVTWGERVGPRKAECEAMAAVYQRTQAATAEDDDLIVVGDFNRNVSDDCFDPLLGLPGMVRANEDTPATHISSTSTYDQVFLSTDFTDEWTGEATTVLFDETLFGNDDAAASLACSDHRPVWVPLSVPGQDDD